MKLLLDHCVPQRLRDSLGGHEVFTAVEMGWDRLRNGVLLRTAAEAGFGALVTVDQNIKYQQNLAKLPLSVIVLCADSNEIEVLAGLVPRLLETIDGLRAIQFVELREDAP